MADGLAVQMVYTQTLTDEVSNTAIPNDDSIPQIGEGEECMTVTITPKSATNILNIRSTVLLRAANKVCSIALFQDTTANALAASKTFTATTGQHSPATIDFFKVAGTTSATTFRIRFGSNDGAAVDLNDVFGAAIKSSLVVTEYKAS